MSGYSSIFSSGLLATPRPNIFSDYVDHSTPSQSYGPVNVDSDPDTTPTKLNTLPTPSSEEVMDYFIPRSRASSNASVTSSLNGAPRLRRRRSSLSVATNGLGAVKSPQRNAGIALQRSALLGMGMGTGVRPSSGSTDVGPTGMPRADEGSYVSAPSRPVGGRSRSGSTGGTMRPRRALRKPPPVPPPNVPLPPLPTSVAVTEVGHRRPLVHRARTTENFSASPRIDMTPSAFLGPPIQLMSNLKVTATIGATHTSSSPLAEISAFWDSACANEN